VLVRFPFTDLSATKQRPALVLSLERLNKVRTDLVVAAITSQIPEIVAEDEIVLSDVDLRQPVCPKRRSLNSAKFLQFIKA